MPVILIGTFTIDTDQLLQSVRLGLLSDDPTIVANRREIIDGFAAAAPGMIALGVYDELKKWVFNDAGKKDIASLDALVTAAENAAAGSRDFHTHWVLANCYKYRKKFNKSLESYADALMYVTGGTQDERDVEADLAELYVYLGRAGDAIEKITFADNHLGTWHPWVHAFALHQYAFESVYDPFYPDAADTATATTYYDQSQTALNNWAGFGSNPDALLLRAANLAGIALRRGNAGLSNATQLNDAHTALTSFLAANATNAAWTLKREKRGPFIRRLPLGTDPTNEPAASDLKEYRKRLAKHFFTNLRTARNGANILPDANGNDGEIIEDPVTP